MGVVPGSLYFINLTADNWVANYWREACTEKAMIVGTLRLPVSLKRRTDVLEVLRSIEGPLLAQPGCSGFHIYEEQGAEYAVVVVERWKTKAALEGHIRSEAYRRILAAIEIAGAPPEVCFDYVSFSEGMELIERLRGAESGTAALDAPSEHEPRDPGPDLDAGIAPRRQSSHRAHPKRSPTGPK